MNNIKSQLDYFNLPSLSKNELITLSGGDSPFYDAGVAVGRGIVQFCRWFADVCEENKKTQLAS